MSKFPLGFPLLLLCSFFINAPLRIEQHPSWVPSWVKNKRKIAQTSGTKKQSNQTNQSLHTENQPEPPNKPKTPQQTLPQRLVKKTTWFKHITDNKKMLGNCINLFFIVLWKIWWFSTSDSDSGRWEVHSAGLWGLEGWDTARMV